MCSIRRSDIWFHSIANLLVHFIIIVVLLFSVIVQRFSTPREIWDVVGPLYLRPKVVQEEVLSLHGFSKTGEIGNWDADYTTAADVFKQLQIEQPEITEANGYDDHQYFLKDEHAGNSFEPSKAAPVVLPKDEHSMLDTSLVKVEDATGDVTTDSTMEDSAVPILINEDDDENKPIVIKTEGDATSSRGKMSPWLAVLDARIERLLREGFEIPVVRNKSVVDSLLEKIGWSVIGWSVYYQLYVCVIIDFFRWMKIMKKLHDNGMNFVLT